MNARKEMQNWNSSKWHNDFGDSEIELKILKGLYFKIIDLGFNYEYKLNCIEDGYLSVEIVRNNGIYFEVQVTDVKEETVGLFFNNGDEIYISDLSEIELYIS